jgi:sulfate transport system permease protein
VIVLIPLAAVVARSTDGGLGAFWDAVSGRQAVASLKLTLLMSIAVAAVNAVAGTLVAWCWSATASAAAASSTP